MSDSNAPEIVGYVLERHLPGQGQTLTIFTTDPSFGEPVASLIRASEHEKIVDALDDDLNEEKLRREDERAKAAGKALRHTTLLRAALTWFDQHRGAVDAGAGRSACDAMNQIAQDIRDILPTSPGGAGAATK